MKLIQNEQMYVTANDTATIPTQLFKKLGVKQFRHKDLLLKSHTDFRYNIKGDFCCCICYFTTVSESVHDLFQ